MEPSFKIEFSDQQALAFDQTRLHTVVTEILGHYHYRAAEISVAVVDDPTIRRLNQQYLDHDYETDVISFVLDEDDDSLTGQLIVSTDTAARVAEEVGGSMDDELLLYVAHGMLHLVGEDDTDDLSRQQMRKQEAWFLSTHGVEHRWQSEGGSA